MPVGKSDRLNINNFRNVWNKNMWTDKLKYKTSSSWHTRSASNLLGKELSKADGGGLNSATYRLTPSSSVQTAFDSKLEEFLSQPIVQAGSGPSWSLHSSSSGNDLKYASFVDDVLSQSSEKSSCRPFGSMPNSHWGNIKSCKRVSNVPSPIPSSTKDNTNSMMRNEWYRGFHNRANFKQRVSSSEKLGLKWNLLNDDVESIKDWTQKMDEGIKSLKQGS